MFIITGGILTFYWFTIYNSYKLRLQCKEFAISTYKELVEATGKNIADFVDISKYDKFCLKDFIPIYNMFYEKDEIEKLARCYVYDKNVLLTKYSKEIEDLDRKNDARYKESTGYDKLTYFIGENIGEATFVINFSYDGQNFTFESSDYYFSCLPKEEQAKIFRTYLYNYYYGLNPNLFASYNIDKIFDENVVSQLNTIFNYIEYNNMEQKTEDSIKLTRKK